MRMPTPIVNQAGERFLQRLSQRDPQLYAFVTEKMNRRGMAGMGDLWDSIGGAFGDVLRSAPAIMQSELDAKRRMDAAEQMAKQELDRAALQIQQQQLAAQNLRTQQEILLAQQQLEQEKANLDAARNQVLTAGQKVGLGMAAILTLLLIVMVTRRKQRGR